MLFCIMVINFATFDVAAFITASFNTDISPRTTSVIIVEASFKRFEISCSKAFCKPFPFPSSSLLFMNCNILVTEPGEPSTVENNVA